jgi:Fe-S-cluster-containing dehydrogenase component
MKIGRRGFFKIAAVTVGAAGASTATATAAAHGAAEDGPGVLVDTTLCVGCRACEAACAEANHLAPPPEDAGVFDEKRDTHEQAFTVVNRTEKAPGVERFAKKQCMHCLAPGCASACPVKAMTKSPEGPVVYNPNRCMGCRYCMIACPFDVPKYEYGSNAPRVRKCSFCAERQAKGLKPACTEVCPSGPLTFGKPSELLEAAKTRIYTSSDRYVHHVYGEREAGGTSWLYITDVPLDQLALRTDVPERPYPDLVAGALGAPPFVMTLWPPLLMGLYAFSHRKEKVDEAHSASAAAKEDHHG